MTFFLCRLRGKITCRAPLTCSASKAARFKVGREGEAAAVISVTTKASIDCVFLSQTLTWSGVLISCSDESSRSKEPLVIVLVFDFVESPCSRELSAWAGNFVMNFSGRKRDRDLRIPEYQEPQPSEGLLPDRRSLAFRALEREDSM